jgi:hypothetical protein
MSKRTIGIILIAIGVILAIVSIAADAFGIGSGNGIGPRQILGTVVGVLIALGGVWLARSKEGQTM